MPRKPSLMMILVLQCLGAFILVMQGSQFSEQFFANPNEPPKDLSQDWCSARSYLDGLPIYGPLAEAITRYIYQPKPGEVAVIHHNAHPPPSVLFLIPFATLPYDKALVVWHLMNLAMLGFVILLIFHEFGWHWQWWFTLPFLGFLMIFDPFRQQVIQGQWHGVLLFFMTLAWWAERRGWPILAGIFAGLAGSLKAFPLLLGFYFLCRKQWKACFSMAGMILLLSLFCIGLFGWNSYQDWIRVVQEDLHDFRASWVNISLTGFWTKLLTGSPIEKERVVPVLFAPELGRWLNYASMGLVLCVLAWTAWRAKSERDVDGVFALGVTSMLLLSPLTWGHSLLLLVYPFLCFIREWLHKPVVIAIILGLIYLATFMNASYWAEMAAAKTTQHMAEPREVWLSLSHNFYALVLFYAAQIYTIIRSKASA